VGNLARLGLLSWMGWGKLCKKLYKRSGGYFVKLHRFAGAITKIKAIF
jgi:hypothetical protein